MEIEALEKKNSRKKAKVPPHPLPVAYELELRRIIEHEAYLRAERDGFKLSPEEYWLAAEKEVHCCF